MLPQCEPNTLDTIIQKMLQSSNQQQQNLVEYEVEPPLKKPKMEPVDVDADISSGHLDELSVTDDSLAQFSSLDDLESSALALQQISAFSSPQPFDLNLEFALVPGRLSLLSQSKKHRVRVGEVMRRVSEPESLNASVLGGILRRAKAKNTGQELRALLSAVGLQLPSGKRKAAPITLFTPLVESEAIQLGADFNSICQEEFPSAKLAQTAVSNLKQSNGNVENRVKELKAAMHIMDEFFSLAFGAQKQGPYFDQPDHPLYTLDILTHGFGSMAFIAFHSVFRRYIRDQLSALGVPLCDPTMRRSMQNGAGRIPSASALPLQLGQPLASLCNPGNNPFFVNLQQQQSNSNCSSSAPSPLTNSESTSSASPEQPRIHTPEMSIPCCSPKPEPIINHQSADSQSNVDEISRLMASPQAKLLLENLPQFLKLLNSVSDVKANKRQSRVWKDPTEKALRSENIQLKASSMSDEKTQDARKLLGEAIEKCKIENEIATYLKRKFDERHGGSWNSGSGRVNGVVEWKGKAEGDYFLPAVTFALAVPRTFFCLFFLSLRCLRPPFSTLFARPT
ncbi:hypothetical protein WR25_09806 [Diploscapter pachys]|uniref:Transcription factor AP-2 C-terminal domain-containing protein n=1 Tax=Diploscapter pachys TaxID=2018661 RepID=A0A2A2KGA2_9BILA|nr:hypothetical protein WR25_09806 [Diploscapter pachys]